jgi:hypothetical protein
MTDQVRALTTEELEHVGGGFEAVEHSFTASQEIAAMSKQVSYTMQAADSVIGDISAH